jgi:hypothetical protein
LDPATIPQLLQRLEKMRQQKITLERESRETVRLIQQKFQEQKRAVEQTRNELQQQGIATEPADPRTILPVSTFVP